MNAHSKEQHTCGKADQKLTEEEFCQSVYEDRHLLYHIAYVLLHNSADCEDAVQETVCRAWQKRGALKNPASMRAWLSILDGYSGGTPGIWDHDSAAFPVPAVL
ncbi:MAG: sigma factor [Clostridia bacterium]